MGVFDRLQDEMVAREKAAGLTMADVLSLPDPERRLFNWVMRRGEADQAEMVEGMRLTEAEVDTLLSALVEKGYLRELAYSGGSRYKPRLASKRGSELSTDLWHALSDRTEEERRQS